MSDAGEAVRAALAAGLKLQGTFAGVAGLNGEASGGSLPQALIDTAVSDWGTKTARGREVATAVRLRLAKGQALRLPSMIAAAEVAGEALAGALDGWRVASAVLLRSRRARDSDGTATALIEHRVRLLEI